MFSGAGAPAGDGEKHTGRETDSSQFLVAHYRAMTKTGSLQNSFEFPGAAAGDGKKHRPTPSIAVRCLLISGR